MNHQINVFEMLRKAGLAVVLAAVVASVSSCNSSSAPPASGASAATVGPAVGSSTAVPDHYFFDPAKLPPPYQTPSVNNGPRLARKPASLHVPAGFGIDTWAGSLNNPREIVVAPNGDVFVAESLPGRVTILRDSKNSGLADVVSHFATGLTQPFGIALYPPGPSPKYVYIANTNSVIRYPYKLGDLTPSGPAETIVPQLPARGYNNHWTRNLLFTPDGKKLMVTVGSGGNVEVGEDQRRAAILRFNPDGGDMEIYASGLRNPVGLAWNPVTGALWTAVNERDGFGDELPNDYVTSVKQGGFYGWPYYYLGQNHDPRMPENADLKSHVIVPDVLVEAHAAALSITFYNGTQFPKEYVNDGFTAMHGSWNRSKRAGYKIVRIPMTPQGTPKGGYDDFVWGFVEPGDDDIVTGRPVSTAVAKDGSLLFSDDGAGKIWRVSYKGSK